MRLLVVVSLHGIFAAVFDSLILLVGHCVVCNTITAMKSWNGMESSFSPRLNNHGLISIYVHTCLSFLWQDLENVYAESSADPLHVTYKK